MRESILYAVRIKRSAEKELNRLSAEIHGHISVRILDLESKPRPTDCKKLSGTGEYRIRLGDYRVLYTIDDKARVVEIVAVGHRGEVYRKQK